jgi:hypothetical protein
VAGNVTQFTHVLIILLRSPFGASLFITFDRFRHYQVSIGLVYSIHDSTEVAIQKMIDFSQRMTDVQSKVTGEAKDGWGLSPVMKKHLELEIRTLKKCI